jgi:hypothetical protein
MMMMKKKKEATDPMSDDTSETSSWRPIKNEEKAMVSNAKRKSAVGKRVHSLCGGPVRHKKAHVRGLHPTPSTETEENTPVKRPWWSVVRQARANVGGI